MLKMMKIIIGDICPHPKLAWWLFLAMILLFSGYVLRGTVPYNFELLFGFFLVVLVYLLKAESWDDLTQKSVLVWGGLILSYVISVFAISLFHAPLLEESRSVLRITALFIGFLVVLAAILLTKPAEDFFWYFLLVSSFVLLVPITMELTHYGWKVFEGEARLGRAYSNPIKFGVYANALFILMLGGFVWAYRQGKKVLVLWCVMTLINFLAVVLSQSRTAWIGWPEAIIGWGGFYLYLISKAKFSFEKKLFLVGGIVSILALIGVTFVGEVMQKRVVQAWSDVEQYLTEENVETSVGRRLVMYEVGIDLIKEQPFLGHGADDFESNLTSKTAQLLTEKYNVSSNGFHFSQIHNQFLMTWINFGLIPFILIVLIFIFLLGFFLRGLKKSRGESKAIWVAGLVFTSATILLFMPESPLQYSTYSAHVGLFLTLLVAFSLLNQKSFTSLRTDKSVLE